MIKFFRRIRQNLLMENKTGKYLKYAIGEIVLIIIGIFVALQLNNWNETRKQTKEFDYTIEQLFNTLHYDSEQFKNRYEYNIEKIRVIDSVIYKSDSISDHWLPYIITSLTHTENFYITETSVHAERLKSNPNNPTQKELVKQLVKYSRGLTLLENRTYTNRLKDWLNDHHFSTPKNIEDGSHQGWNTIDSSYYSPKEILLLRDALKTRELKSILKEQKDQLVGNAYTDYAFYSSSSSILKYIKEYYPYIQLKYVDVGIIGSAIDGWDKEGYSSTPMQLTNVNNQIWETTLSLKEGHVKFRTRDSWAENWGGDSFPNGSAQFGGEDIPVSEAGNYRVILNLTKKSYQFIKQDD